MQYDKTIPHAHNATPSTCRSLGNFVANDSVNVTPGLPVKTMNHSMCTVMYLYTEPIYMAIV